MTKEHLRAVRDAAPFSPFTIYMADGRSVKVPHRDFIFLPPVGRIVIAYDAERSMHLLDLLLMTELAIDVSSAQPNGVNGQESDS